MTICQGFFKKNFFMTLTIGERIKKTREELDLTQQEFAEKIGLTASNISKVERNISEISSKYLVHIVTIFNINSTWLLTGEGEMYEKKEIQIEDSNPGIDKDIKIKEIIRWVENNQHDCELIYQIIKNKQEMRELFRNLHLIEDF